jgi:hypothetical protein
LKEVVLHFSRGHREIDSVFLKTLKVPLGLIQQDLSILTLVVVILALVVVILALVVLSVCVSTTRIEQQHRGRRDGSVAAKPFQDFSAGFVIGPRHLRSVSPT